MGKLNGFLTDFPEYYLAYAEGLDLKEAEIKSYCGVIYTEPTVYELNPSKFLNDEDLLKLLYIYRGNLHRIKLRKAIVNALSIFFDTGNKAELQKLIQKVLSLNFKPLNLKGKENKDKISQSRNFKFFEAEKVNGGGEFVERLITVPVERGDYVFSEGIKFKALTETIKELTKVLPYMEEFLKIVEELKVWFEGEKLNILTDAVSKLLILNPEFTRMDEEKNLAVYTLRLVNRDKKRKAEKMAGAYPQLLREVNIPNEKKRAFIKRLNILYRSGEYLKVVETYLKHKVLIRAKFDKETVREEIYPRIEKLVKLWNEQVEDFERVRNWIVKNSSGFKKRELYNEFTPFVEENIGTLLVLEEYPSYPLTGYLDFKKVPFQGLFPFEVESLGELVDAFLVAKVLSEQNDSLILSINDLEGLKYRRLKAIFNLLIKNQTITERGYRSLRYGMDNILRSLQKNERKGVVKAENVFGLEIYDYVLVETFVSNRVKEVLREDFERLNELTAHRVFKVVKITNDIDNVQLETIGTIGVLAGDFKTTELVVKTDEWFKKGENWLVITQSGLKEENFSKLLTRLNVDYERLSVVSMEDVNLILNTDINTTEGYFHREEDGLLIMKPLPNALKRFAMNERAIFYRGLNSDSVLNTLASLHLLYSDSRNFPFSSLKLTKQRLGKLKVGKGEVYYSIALLELYLRFLKLGIKGGGNK